MLTSTEQHLHSDWSQWGPSHFHHILIGGTNQIKGLDVTIIHESRRRILNDKSRRNWGPWNHCLQLVCILTTQVKLLYWMKSPLYNYIILLFSVLIMLNDQFGMGRSIRKSQKLWFSDTQFKLLWVIWIDMQDFIHCSASWFDINRYQLIYNPR